MHILCPDSGKHLRRRCPLHSLICWCTCSRIEVHAYAIRIDVYVPIGFFIRTFPVFLNIDVKIVTRGFVTEESRFSRDQLI